jgi:hypothetical protein
VLPEAPPDHSTISRTRRLIDLDTRHAVVTWILQRLADAGLVKGKTIGIDAATLEANAARRSIVHAAALNLGLLMRTLFGAATPRGLQGRTAVLGKAFATAS